jgi:hypothetical protein
MKTALTVALYLLFSHSVALANGAVVASVAAHENA